MVVLDGHSHSHSMLGAGPYIQPDYLSTLPTTLDAKKSPLALLAQTCSQIGADTPNSKSLLPSSLESNKRKSSTSSECNSINSSESGSLKSGSGQSQDRCDRDRERGDSNPRPRSGGNSSTSSSGLSNSKPTPPAPGKSSPAFKPYESSVPSTKVKDEILRSEQQSSSQGHQDKPKTPSKRPASSSPHESSSGSGGKNPRKSPSIREKNQPSPVSSEGGKSSPKSNGYSNSERGASPIIRSGLEVLHGQGLGMKANGSGSALSSLSALAAHYPPGFDLSNPALRPPFFAPPSAHHFFGGGYPPSALSANGAGGSPYVSYTRVKTPSGAETIVPVCKDPYCGGCSLSMQGLMANAAAAAAAAGFPGLMSGSTGVCPAGCAQCDHQKFSLPLPPFLAPPGLGYPPTSGSSGYPASLMSQHAQAQAAQQLSSAQRHHVCNWTIGDTYCGKRFSSPEELLQHLQTHTRLPTSQAEAAAANLASMGGQSALYSQALLSSSMNAMNAAAAAAAGKFYPTPPLSPMSAAAAARYHPYAASAAAAAAAGKPGGIGAPGSMSSMVHPQSLANYYSSMSPYALYGQRIGPPVHP